MSAPKDAKFKVDYDRLKNALEAQGESFRGASKALGYTITYLASQRSVNGKLAKCVVMALENMYGITYDEYKPLPKEPFAVEETQLTLDITTLRKEHAALEKMVKQIGAMVADLTKTLDATYNNTVETRRTATETWQKMDSVLYTVNEINTATKEVKKASGENANRMLEVLALGRKRA